MGARSRIASVAAASILAGISLLGISVVNSHASAPDFSNFTYTNICGHDRIKLLGGIGQDTSSEKGLNVFRLDNIPVLKGRFNSDETDDYVVALGCSPGSGTYSMLIPFQGTSSGLKQLPTLRLDGQISSLTSDASNNIVLTTLDYGPDDPRCCPSLSSTTIYKLNPRGLIKAKASDPMRAAGISLRRQVLKNIGLSGSPRCYSISVLRSDNNFGRVGTANLSPSKASRLNCTVFEESLFISNGDQGWRRIEQLSGTSWSCLDWQQSVSQLNLSPQARQYVLTLWCR